MNLSDLYLQKLNQIAQLNKSAEEKFRFSDTLLFRDYQTRLFQWKDALNYDGIDGFNRMKSFHNLFLDLSPKWENEIFPDETVMADFKEHGFKNMYFTNRDYNRFFLSMYLNWEFFKEYAEIKKFHNLPHPYETVFKIIIRGGYVFNHGGVFEIDNRAYLKYDNKFRLPSISENFLLNFFENAIWWASMVKK